jgi:hypothetical protein
MGKENCEGKTPNSALRFCIIPLFAFMLFCQPIFSQTAQQFISITTEPDDAVQIRTLQANDAKYSLILINGNETFIFDPSSGKEINGSALAMKILAEDVYARANFDSKLELSKSTIAAFLAGKKNDEAQCRQLLGTDKLPCTDRESCVRACFGVPLCEGVINADQFWESSRSWTNDTSNLNSAAVDFEKDLDAMREGGVRIQEKIDALDGIIALSDTLYDNPVVLNRTDEGCSGTVTKKCFEYCKHPNYQRGSLVSLRSSLASLKEDLSALSGVQSRANSILFATFAQRTYLSTRAGRVYDLRSSGKYALLRLNESYADASKVIRYSAAEEKIAAANSIYSHILNLSDEGLYGKALAREADFRSAIDTANEKVSEAREKRDAVLARLAAVSEKLNKSRAVIGNESAAPAEEEIMSLTDQMHSVLDYEQLPGFDTAIEDLDNSINGLIVNATVSGASPQAGEDGQQGLGGQAGQAGSAKIPHLPCPAATGLILGIGLIAVLARR